MKTKNLLAGAITSYLLMGDLGAYASGYTAIGGGMGGAANAPNVSVELGAVSTNKDAHNQLFAADFGFIFNADHLPSGTLHYPVPHSDYAILGKKQKGNEYALAGKYGIELIKNQGVFAFGLGGLSFSKEVELARSNVTGWYYENASSSKINGLYGGGLAYFPPNSNWTLSAAYDNRRGITGTVGFRF